MSDKIELLPCPFCGTSDLLGFELSHEGEWAVVKCRKCGCSGSTGRSTSEQEAIAWWNRRAAIAQQHAPAAPAKRLIPVLPEQMARDLARFNETCEDGQEYDVPKDRMRAMASFGLVRWCGGSRFEITDCGITALEAMSAPAAPVAQEPVAWRVSEPSEPEIGHWLSEEPGTSWQLSEPLYTTPPAAEQPHPLEQFTDACSRLHSACNKVREKLAEMEAAEQSDTVKVPREQLEALRLALHRYNNVPSYAGSLEDEEQAIISAAAALLGKEGEA